MWGTDLSATDVAKKSDALLLSVPMSKMNAVIDEIANSLRPGMLIVENASIKNSALPLLMEKCPKEVELLGIHTMFGDEVGSLSGQNVIITKTERTKDRAASFEDMLYKYGAKLTHATMSEHDRISAYLQSLVHLNLVALADVLQQEFSSIDEIRPFSTHKLPPSNREHETCARTKRGVTERYANS